mmetsp:Transcript_9985/g.19893  ORF Transcript_9985/g.19893 Transcript_9985/m.19893 type:complete len:258 (-) Transcript_9985:73-846(-)
MFCWTRLSPGAVGGGGVGASSWIVRRSSLKMSPPAISFLMAFTLLLSIASFSRSGLRERMLLISGGMDSTSVGKIPSERRAPLTSSDISGSMEGGLGGGSSYISALSCVKLFFTGIISTSLCVGCVAPRELGTGSCIMPSPNLEFKISCAFSCMPSTSIPWPASAVCTCLGGSAPIPPPSPSPSPPLRLRASNAAITRCASLKFSPKSLKSAFVITLRHSPSMPSFLKTSPTFSPSTDLSQVSTSSFPHPLHPLTST